MLIVVVGTIDFDYETGRRAIEVDEVFANGLLTTKFPPANSPAA